MDKKRTPPLPVNNTPPPVVNYPRLTPEQIRSEIKSRCGAGRMTYYSRGKHHVFILPEAWEELRSMIYFGKRTPVNTYEQQFQGMGRIFIAVDGRISVVVSHFLYIYSASRGPTHSQIQGGVNDRTLERLEAEREIYLKLEKQYNTLPDGRTRDPFVRYGKCEVVLGGHTHPDLGCFFSPPDHASSFATSSFPAVTFVCDPIRKDMKAMVGVKEEEAVICVMEYDQAAPKPVSAGNRSEPVPTGNRGEPLPAVNRNEPVPVVHRNEPVPVSEIRQAGTDVIQELSRVCHSVLQTLGVTGSFCSSRGMDGKMHIKFTASYPAPRRKP